jgi:Rrf2 family protein
MRFTSKTEYGLVCLIYLAKHSVHNLDPITIKELVQAEQFSLAYTEKILQALRAAKIVVSHQGNHGGYALARRPSEITLKEIIDALEGATFDVFCEPKVREDITCTHFPLCGIKPLWEKTKDLLDQFYGGVTLEMLSKNAIDFSPIPNKVA